MRKTVHVFSICASGAMVASAALVFALAATGCVARAQNQPAPSWTGGDAYQAILNYNNYFYSGQTSTADSSLTLYSGESGYNDSTGNGQNFGVIYNTDPNPTKQPYWSTFWYEAEEMEVAEDAYWWAVTNSGSTGKYLTEVNNLAQGFVDEQYPLSNFCNKTPPWSGGNAYCWHGSGYTDIEYEYPINEGNGNGGDWFNDDLMWASRAFVRAYDVTNNNGTPVSDWLTAAENQVSYVWSNARAQFSADGTQVGLLQSFCNTNKPGDGPTSGETCLQQYGLSQTTWAPNLDAEVNFPFVIAAKMIANDLTAEGDTGDAATYNNEAAKVYAWAVNNLITTTTTAAQTCTTAMTNLANSNSTFASLSTSQTCAEVYDANNSGVITEDGSQQTVGFNGESGYWSWIPASSTSSWDFSMNYGNAIQAAILMGDTTTAQQVANYLMYGLDNNDPNHDYAGTYTYGGISYNILPNYGSEGGNYDGSNGIALRGVSYALYRSDLDQLTLNWAQANLQAAWNNANSNNVMWNDWTPGDTTGGSTDPSYVYNSWDCSDAVVGMLNVAAPGGSGN